MARSSSISGRWRSAAACLLVLGLLPAGVAQESRTASVALDQCFIEVTAPDAGEPGFVLLGRDVSIRIETGRLSWLLTDETADTRRGRVVLAEPVGAREAVAPRGEQLLPGVISRFHGAPEQWDVGQRTWRAVRYAELWEGVDLLMEAQGRTLKSTYVLAPGADPAAVRTRHTGADAVFVDEHGRLVLQTSAGSLVDAAPSAWQEHAGERSAVAVAFELQPLDDGTVDVGFALGDYDRARTLYIDPAVVVQAGFLGGTERDAANDLALDAAGNVYICGWARSSEVSFPVTVGPDLTWAGALSPWGDAFVAKLDPTGQTLLYCGYIGGTDAEFANGIAVDAAGRAYVAGHCKSDEGAEGFPVSVGPDLSMDGSMDAWVARVSADGTSLEYCGYVGGDGFEDRALDIDVDASGRAYLVGHTDSDEDSFPVAVGPDLVKGNATDAWVARVSATGALLEFCGYVGGDSGDECTSVLADGTGGCWIGGWTQSDEFSFPVKGGPDTTHNGASDAYVARVSPSGDSFLHCGYIGGSDSELGGGLAVDATGAIYIVGHTWSFDFPVLTGPTLTNSGGIDVFVCKLAADGSSLIWSGYFGGSSTDVGYGIDVDALGGVWLTGRTSSTESSSVPFPLGGGPDSTANGSSDGFLARVLPDGSGVDHSGFVGGSGYDYLTSVALVPEALTPGVREVWLVGAAASDENSFPVVSGPDVTHNGDDDAVVVRIQIAPDPWTDLGNGLAGVNGVPLLVGEGTLGSLSPLTLTLSNARPLSTAWFVLGFSAFYAPFKGGVMVPDPTPPSIVAPVPTDGLGGIVLQMVMPPNPPAGVDLFFQWWIQDVAGPVGFAASNALRGTTP